MNIDRDGQARLCPEHLTRFLQAKILADHNFIAEYLNKIKAIKSDFNAFNTDSKSLLIWEN